MIPASTIERARRLYTGVDPDTGAELGEADCARMGGAAIAEACGVHPHTVDGWIRRFAWSRPPWYRKRAGRKPVQPGAVAQALVARIEAAASTGTALPDNFRLARDLRCSIQGVTTALRGLRADGWVRSERDGPCRRLVLRDGRATAWTRPQGRAAAPGCEPVERRTMAARVLEAIQGWVEAGDPMPGDIAGGTAVGCDSSSFRRALRTLRESRKLTVENRSNRRRIVLADGRATKWSVPQLRTKPIDAVRLRALRPVRFGAAPLDLVVEEAVRSLRRQGPVVYDLAVVTGCAPGVAWSVDGRTLTRDQLLAEAARRNARAIQQLSCGAPVSP